MVHHSMGWSPSTATLSLSTVGALTTVGALITEGLSMVAPSREGLIMVATMIRTTQLMISQKMQSTYAVEPL